MTAYYKHPFRNFDSRSDAGAPPAAQPAAQAAEEYTAQPQNQAPPASGAGGETGGAQSGKDALIAFLFQGRNAKITIPAVFIIFSVLYFYIYDAVTSTSGDGILSKRQGRGKKQVVVEQINDEELSDPAFESSRKRDTWRPPGESETRSVEEARSNVGFFGRLFCRGGKRSRWCE